MEEKTNVASAKKRNVLLVILAVAVAAIIIAVVIALSVRPRTQLEAKPSASNQQSVSASQSTPQTPSSSNTKPDDSDEPTMKEIVFEMPVVGGTIFNEYTEASVTFNKTLGVYMGHMGIDISGEEGAQVTAAYDGTIVDITTTYLQGTTIKIDHGNGLTSVYNSVDALETLKVNQSVKTGDVLGTISTNNKQEYKDGAHLHFEVLENGKTVDPYKYLAVSGK